MSHKILSTQTNKLSLYLVFLIWTLDSLSNVWIPLVAKDDNKGAKGTIHTQEKGIANALITNTGGA